MRSRLALLTSVLASVLASGCQGGVTDPTASETPTRIAATPVMAAGAPPEEFTTLGCERLPGTPVVGAPVVPEGATAARLCGGWVHNAGFDLAWPTDTLTGERVDLLVERLNELEPYTRPSGCTLPASPPFDLVLAYPDGTRVSLHGETAGSCAHITVRGAGKWDGAGNVLRLARNLISVQRDTSPRTGPIEAPPCPEKWNDVYYIAGAGPVSEGDPIAVTACRYALDFEPGRITQSASGKLVGSTPAPNPQGVFDLIASGSRVDPCDGVEHELTRIQDVFLVADAHGDIQPVSTAPCWANTLTRVRRYPSDALREMAEALHESP